MAIGDDDLQKVGRQILEQSSYLKSIMFLTKVKVFLKISMRRLLRKRKK